MKKIYIACGNFGYPRDDFKTLGQYDTNEEAAKATLAFVKANFPDNYVEHNIGYKGTYDIKDKTVKSIYNIAHIKVENVESTEEVLTREINDLQTRLNKLRNEESSILAQQSTLNKKLEEVRAEWIEVVNQQSSKQQKLDSIKFPWKNFSFDVNKNYTFGWYK